MSLRSGSIDGDRAELKVTRPNARSWHGLDAEHFQVSKNPTADPFGVRRADYRRLGSQSGPTAMRLLEGPSATIRVSPAELQVISNCPRRSL
jgi:hypothetical protein